MNESYIQSSKPVVACLDGGDDGDRALRYAIEEAQRRETGVRLVHVIPEILAYAPMSPVYETPNLRDIGSRVLKDALERCHELAPDLFVDGTVSDGHRVSTIVEESEKAAAVVLGTREWRVHRVFGGSTTMGVASHAHCPVIAVPPTWSPGSVGGKVVVGVDEYAGPDVVLTRGFEEARGRKAELSVVHAWTPPYAYGPAFGSYESDEWKTSMQDRLAELTAAVRAEYADVPTHLVATFGTDRTALAEIASDAALLVVGRHHRAAPLIQRLGSVARHAIHAGACPVEIVPVPEQ